MKGHVRKRGTQSWAVVFDLGRDENGKRKQKWHKGTKRDAEREMARLVHELNTGSYIEPSRISVGEYLDRWLADHAKQNVSGKTFERYSEIVSKNLKPALGNLPLAKLRPLDIQGFYGEALRSGRRDGKGGLSAQTVVHIHRVLSAAMTQAVKWEMVIRNPADAIEPPRASRKEMKAIDEDETARLFEAARGTNLYMPILLTACTGMRRGEILALPWRNVDLDAMTLSVSRSLEQTKEGLRFKETKNRTGRVIDLPEIAVEALREHRAIQRERQTLLGDAYAKHGLVCCREDGNIWKPDSFTDSYFRFTRKIGIKLRFHDLRHSHASQLLRQGVSAKVVSERLGHSSIGITLDIYSHVLPGMQKEAAAKINLAFKSAVEKLRRPIA